MVQTEGQTDRQTLLYIELNYKKILNFRPLQGRVMISGQNELNMQLNKGQFIYDVKSFFFNIRTIAVVFYKLSNKKTSTQLRAYGVHLRLGLKPETQIF